jgi:hypothetical protein
MSKRNHAATSHRDQDLTLRFCPASSRKKIRSTADSMASRCRNEFVRAETDARTHYYLQADNRTIYALVHRPADETSRIRNQTDLIARTF